MLFNNEIIPKQCPYCKVSFRDKNNKLIGESSWIYEDYPEVICWLCKKVAEQYKLLQINDNKL